MDALARSREALIQALGRQSAFWGLGRTAGEIYAALYLSPVPLSLEEVARSLKVTKGNVSVAIRQLERMGMVRRSFRPGDRRVFFEAEADLWKITHTVLGLRQKPEFDQSFALVEESLRSAREAGPSAERDSVVERLAALQDFYRLLDRVVEGVLAMNPGRLRGVVEMLPCVLGGNVEREKASRPERSWL